MNPPFPDAPVVPVSADLPALIAKLIETELGFSSASKRVMVYNQRWNIPQTDDLFIVVGVLNEDNFGAGSGYRYDPVAEQLNNVQILEQSITLTIDAFSKSTEARRRLQEIFFALDGDAAQRLSEQYSLRINRPTAFLDLSHLEASAMLNRFQTQVAVFQGTGQSKAVPSMIPAKPLIKTRIQP